MSDLKVQGFKASEILAQLNNTFGSLSDSERAAQIKKTAAIFELHIKNADKQEAVWTLDLKDTGTIYAGPVKAPAKPGVTLIMSDETFEQVASGKMDGQKAFMTGKLKSKGNLMLATKLAGVLGTTKTKAKL
ncbi:SCP2 sterol-binding domain-containing protein [Boletus reticuloceps]|uniref:SCP2 sterol-binding domain-containing protein n=1 Tax=Boletus reticuloceps TaxID=495285 RepID=A0A8I3A8V8_9AGAM|nr:SCP2 sterol-binding domain-containing protein [Boletus reticuloceps]